MRSVLPRNVVAGLVGLAVATLGGCDPLDPVGPDEQVNEPLYLTKAAGETGDGCDMDMDPGDWCDPGDPESGGSAFDYNTFRGFIGRHDDNLYQAGGDPHPSSPGVWLGTGVTPGACAANAGPTDLDGDGFKDSCEFSLARSFAPLLQFSASEPCAKGAPAWSVRSSSPGVVRIAYMMGYYIDCGFGIVIAGNTWKGGHAGDSEIVTLRVRHNAATGHWEFTEMWTSAHYGEGGLLRGLIDQSRLSGPSSVNFPVKPLAFPKVWVAEKKHANYPSSGLCNNSPNGDYCTNHAPTRYRFPVDPSRNAGGGGLPYCLPSPDFPGLECFHPGYMITFKGWQAGAEGVTPYGLMLLAGGFYSN